ncbi:hypothetical protein GC254_22710, partial [Escherichia coli]|nr:hypothetical protein [Escherichia coli]
MNLSCYSSHILKYPADQENSLDIFFAWIKLSPLKYVGNDSNLLIVFYVQIMPDDFVMQLHR